MPLDWRDYSIPKAKKPIPRSEALKRIVAYMWDKEWVTLGELQEHMQFRRSRLRRVIKKMVEAGILETELELSLARCKKRIVWLPSDATPDGSIKYRHLDGLLTRNYRFYRLKKENINIQVEKKKDPSK